MLSRKKVIHEGQEYITAILDEISVSEMKSLDTDLGIGWVLGVQSDVTVTAARQQCRILPSEALLTSLQIYLPNASFGDVEALQNIYAVNDRVNYIVDRFGGLNVPDNTGLSLSGKRIMEGYFIYQKNKPSINDGSVYRSEMKGCGGV